MLISLLNDCLHEEWDLLVIAHGKQSIIHFQDFGLETLSLVGLLRAYATLIEHCNNDSLQ